jgi:hypothetical protein
VPESEYKESNVSKLCQSQCVRVTVPESECQQSQVSTCKLCQRQSAMSARININKDGSRELEFVNF